MSAQRAPSSAGSAELERHRAKLREIFAFWNWTVADGDLALRFINNDDISLALWHVTAATPERRQFWVISEPTGVLPIDHLDYAAARDVSEALRMIGRAWVTLASQSLEQRLGRERCRALLAQNPGAVQQDAAMRRMIGLAASLLVGLAEGDG